MSRKARAETDPFVESPGRGRIDGSAVSSYAAQAAFFVFLSAMPFGVFFSALANTVSRERFDISRFLPQPLRESAEAFFGPEMPTAALISVSAVTALWSASRGVLALTRGLNAIYGIRTRRGFFRRRLFAVTETLILEAALLCVLIGTSRGAPIRERLARFGVWGDVLCRWGGFFCLGILFLFLYSVLPDRTVPARRCVAGAVASSEGWIVFGELYAYYVEYIADFSRVYGALAGVAALMTWLYSCLYLFFFGALLNRFLQESDASDGPLRGKS